MSLVRRAEQAERRAEEAERRRAEAVRLGEQGLMSGWKGRAESAEQTIARVREWAEEAKTRPGLFDVGVHVLSLLELSEGGDKSVGNRRSAPLAESDRCPTCGSDDPGRCRANYHDHPVGSLANDPIRAKCCPDPFHDGTGK